MADRYGQVSWPGVVAPDSFNYTISHGISPGVATLTTLPQLGPPADRGSLVFTDGVNTITLPDCKVDKITSRQDGSGFLWTLTIKDRRWKWFDLGQISGEYNLRDSRNKLIPATIRSPKELAILCLEAMGEQRYTIDLPDGMTRQNGLDAMAVILPDFGLNDEFGTNPQTNWVQKTPACALAELCELYGRRVIYRWSDDSVLIAIPGQGSLLPSTGSIALDAPGLDSPDTPAGVAVAGNPTRYQVRLLLEAVGKEWNGHYRPIGHLSYRPTRPESQAQKVRFVFSVPTAFGAVWTVFLNPAGGTSLRENALTFDHTSVGGDTPGSVATALAALINAANLFVTASVVDGDLIVTHESDGVLFTAAVEVTSPATDAAGSVTIEKQALAPDDRDAAWWYPGDVHLCANVRDTEQLTKTQAMQLAQESVFRCYRVADVDVANVTNPGAINVPGYGRLVRRQQLGIEPTKVEQIFPQPEDATLLDRNNSPVVIEFYNGYAHDRPAACYGSVSKEANFGPAGYVRTTPDLLEPNTGPNDRIFVPFTVDATEQIITFADPVWCQIGANAIGPPPRLVLECAVTVRNADTNSPECYAMAEAFPGRTGTTNYAIRKFPDVQLNVIGLYDDNDNVTGSTLLEQDAIRRASYYLAGLKAQYFVASSQLREWNGIEALDLDGAIMQITWTIQYGCKTTASRNSEHSIYVPPYPTRRRAEFLTAAQLQNNPYLASVAGYGPNPYFAAGSGINPYIAVAPPGLAGGG